MTAHIQALFLSAEEPRYLLAAKAKTDAGDGHPYWVDFVVWPVHMVYDGDTEHIAFDDNSHQYRGFCKWDGCMQWSTHGSDGTSHNNQHHDSAASILEHANMMLAGRMDFPAGKGQPQHAWEPPRTVQGRHKGRAERLKSLGNGWVPLQAAAAFEYLWKELHA